MASRARMIANSSRNRALYRRDIEGNRARSRLRKQRLLIERTIQRARAELANLFNSSSIAT